MTSRIFEPLQQPVYAMADSHLEFDPTDHTKMQKRRRSSHDPGSDSAGKKRATENSLDAAMDTAQIRETAVDEGQRCQHCHETGVYAGLVDVIEGRRKHFEVRLGSRHRTCSCRFCKPRSHGSEHTNTPPTQFAADRSCASCSTVIYSMRQAEGTGDIYMYLDPDDVTCLDPTKILQVFRVKKCGTAIRFSPRNARKSLEYNIGKHQEAQERLNRVVDLSFFRDEIEAYQKHHEKCRVGNHRKIAGLRLIECQKREVVCAPPDCKYAALSYVWGSSSTQSDDLHNLPKTIEDALVVADKLGFQYIWIDRYCIDQDNKRETHAQIQQMGLIYGQAEVTIIAAAGRNPEHGLPGVTTARAENTLFKFGQHRLRPLWQSSENLVSQSVWMTRAWTYQECILSRRRLFFTSQHVFLECQQEMIEEWPVSACRCAYIIFALDRKTLGCSLQNKLSFTPHSSNMDRFNYAIQRYTKRELTYPSDMLNGIIGVLSTFESCSPPVRHHLGLPIMNHTWGQESVVLNLPWRLRECGRRAVRRREFPSWSWTGWEGEPQLPYRFGTNSGLVDISVEVENGEVIPLKTFAASKVSVGFQTSSPVLRIEGWAAPVKCSSHLEETFVLLDEDVFQKAFLRPAEDVESTLWDRLHSGKCRIHNIWAIWVNWDDFTRIGQFLLIEQNETSAERVGTLQMSLWDDFDTPMVTFEEALKLFRTLIPQAKRRQFRLV